MNARNCKNCGRIFNYVSGLPLCPACRDLMEEKFQTVKEYIQNNKDTTMKTVAEECDVDENQIRQWIREERLVFADDSGIVLQCEICGRSIRTGRYCDKCKQETMRDLAGAGRQPVRPQPVQKKEKENPRMRFLDNR
ncbi:MAG: flagellar protein [Lachnospiraceae bacterium]|nr:flagellar protein [Lachnospiraceae bacterium]